MSEQPEEPLFPYDLSEGARLVVPRLRPFRNALDEPPPPRWRRLLKRARWAWVSWRLRRLR